MQEKWQLLLANFGDKEYIDGAYYRLRQTNDGNYEIAIIHGGPCGETLYNPQIKVAKENLQPIELLDNFGAPVKFLNYQQAPQELDQALAEVVEKFLVAKGLA